MNKVKAVTLYYVANDGTAYKLYVTATFVMAHIVESSDASDIGAGFGCSRDAVVGRMADFINRHVR
jgi:hypothetical protein